MLRNAQAELSMAIFPLSSTGMGSAEGEEELKGGAESKLHWGARTTLFYGGVKFQEKAETKRKTRGPTRGKNEQILKR